MWHRDSSQMRQLHGCSVCRWAGNSTAVSSIAPTLKPTELVELTRSGKHYYCVEFMRPVYSDEGKSCPRFRLDS